MWSNILKWIENIWKLREIFDKYLPMVKAHKEALVEAATTIRKLQAELEKIKANQAKQQVQLDTNFTILSDLGGTDCQKTTEVDVATAVEASYTGVVSE